MAEKRDASARAGAGTPPRWWRSVAVAGVLAAVLVVVLRLPIFHMYWKGTHWLFDYEFGFIKRGLVGTIAGPFLGTPTPEVLLHLGSVTAAITLGLLLWWFILPVWRAGAPVYLVLWLLFALLHSATLQNLWIDALRFDHINLWILLGVLWILPRIGEGAGLGVVAVAGVLSILVHEAAFFISVPVMLGALVYCGARPARVGLIGALMVLCTGVVGALGRISVPQEEYLAHLEQRAAFPVDETSVAVLYAGVTDNLGLAAEWLVLPETLVGHLMLFLLLVPTAAGLWFMGREVLQRLPEGDRSRAGALVVAALGPLALYPLGLDFPRWWALTLLNAFVVLGWLGRDDPDVLRGIEAGSRRARLWIAVAVVMAVMLGPLGINYFFPMTAAGSGGWW